MKNKTNINHLKPNELFQKHVDNFKDFQVNINELYADNPNKDKIVALLDYWIFSISCLKKIYGERGLIDFCNGASTSHLRFSILYEFSDIPKGLPIKKANSYRIIFNLLNLFIRTIYIPGATLLDLKSRILNKFSFYYYHSIPMQEDLLKKQKLFKIINNMMKDCLSKNEIAKIKDKMPKVFYSNSVNSSFFKSKIFVKGSCASFLEFSGIENIFLLNTKLKIEGYQHGGGYDIFQIDYFAEYEKRLSDTFYGWGFSCNNKPQKKFKKLKIRENSQKRVLWIEDSVLPSFYFCTMPQHHYQSINRETKNYIFNELRYGNFQYSSLYHPDLKSNLYNKLRKDDYAISGNGPSENLIMQDDILIFDNSGATLIHFAIENEISFYQIISRLDFENFTDLQKEFFLILHKYDFGIFNDEENKLSNSISKIKLNSNHSLPKELIDFYERTFK